MSEHDLRTLLAEAADDTGRPAVPLPAPEALARGRRRRRVRAGAAVVVAAAVVVGAVGVGRQVSRGGAIEADCEIVLRVDGELYAGRYDALRREPELTGREVPAGVPDCADTGGDPGPDEATTAAELAGVPVEDAVWWHRLVLVRRGATLPAWTEQWYDALRCDPSGPRDLVVTWLDAGRSRWSTVRVDATSPDDPSYLRAIVRVRNGTGGPLDRSVLDGSVPVRVRCAGARFVLESVG